MRAVKAITLIILVGFNLFGFYAMFLFRQAEIKNEMSVSIADGSSNNRETLIFSKAAFAQLSLNDNGNELRLNGKLYDVVSTETKGGQINLTVECDTKETALVDAFGDMLSQQQDKPSNSSPLKTIISHFQQDYVNAKVYSFSFSHLSKSIGRITNCTYHTSSFVADNLTPPPQFFLV